MRRPRHLVTAIIATVLVQLVPSAHAASPASGTISCSVFSDENTAHAAGLIFRPFINGEPRTVRIAGVNVGSSCDNSAVSGGKVPITGVQLKLTARLPEGTCSALTSPLVMLQNARVTLKWRGLNGANHYTAVATTRARVLSAGYDIGTHTLNLVTEPATGNAFLGNQFTIRLGFDYFADVFEGGCGNNGGFVAQSFGNIRPASLSNE